MFVTFFSYKGGVGRTLAVANVAHLLATHEQEPRRVLLWDFDLEAPGLQHVFKCKWRGKKRVGFVDLVHEYVTQVRIPDIAEYIHPTDVDGVDILPAGNPGKRYRRMAEALDWLEVYERRRGYDFMQVLRDAIAALRAEGRPVRYDYVLIDAPAGYSDVAGICAQQLPDVVVLMFRLNDQSIRGTAEVCKAIRSWTRRPEGPPIEVIPVISPAWPSSAPEARRLAQKAQRMLGEGTPLTFTLEPALTHGDTLICRERNRYVPVPRICDDYAKLADSLRALALNRGPSPGTPSGRRRPRRTPGRARHAP